MSRRHAAPRRLRLPRRPVLLAALAGLLVPMAAVPCPADTTVRAADTVLTVQLGAAAPRAYGPRDLAALPARTLQQRLAVTAGDGGTATERSVTYGGLLLRDVLLHAGFGGPQDRAARTATVEAVASDGYRAVFSWGELFNTAVGDQAIVITAQDGQPLEAFAGPLALRSLADLRPGPRHVRNLCALVVKGR